MLPSMLAPDTSVVDLIRAFLEARRALADVAARYRAGALDFSAVQALVGDDEESALFRLKERSHALYRTASDAEADVGPGVLFDLAVGSLFHEAMKFREGYYQQSVYGPKVETLLGSEREDARALGSEFAKILGETRVRIDESLREAEALLHWTVGQLPALFRAHGPEGPLARLVVERAPELGELLGMDADALLVDLCGSVDEARFRAAASYLDSGFFAEAARVLRPVETPAAIALLAYADGMSAYLSGRYPECVDRLSAWIEAGPPAPGLTSIAVSALERAGAIDEEDGGSAAAAPLAARIRATQEADASQAGTATGSGLSR